MRLSLRFFLVLFFGLTVSLQGQENPAKPRIAPEGLFTIPPNIDYESLKDVRDIPELLKRIPDPLPEFQDDPRFDKNVWAKNIRFSRDVWCLQFAFKSVRIVDVDIPNARGTLDRKKVWYLVYNVKNLGPADGTPEITHINGIIGTAVPKQGELTLPVAADEMPPRTGKNERGDLVTRPAQPRSAPLDMRSLPGRFEAVPGQAKAVTFIPQFSFTIRNLVLETLSANNPQTGKREATPLTKAVNYNDQIIPLAMPVIMEREGMKSAPETSVSIAAKEIAPGQDLWGIATWTDIDPRVNEFSIYVTGLTNAYKWTEKTIKAKKGDNSDEYANTGKIGEGRILKRKVLKTDWWRLGDQFSLDDAQIRYGSKEGLMPVSIFETNGDFNRDGTVDAEEAKRYRVIFEAADTTGKKVKKDGKEVDAGDGYLSDQEKAEYNRIHQIWLKPTYGYEWLYL